MCLDSLYTLDPSLWGIDRRERTPNPSERKSTGSHTPPTTLSRGRARGRDPIPFDVSYLRSRESPESKLVKGTFRDSVETLKGPAFQDLPIFVFRLHSVQLGPQVDPLIALDHPLGVLHSESSLIRKLQSYLSLLLLLLNKFQTVLILVNKPRRPSRAYETTVSRTM